MPNENEYTTGLKNLAAVDWSVDYVLTHCGPSSIVDIFSRGFYEHDELTDYLDRVREKTTFTRWFFGHYHDNREIGEDFVLLYEQMIYAAGLDRE